MASDERGAQFEAAGFLVLRDGDGGEEGLFGGSGVGGVLLQQDFAANAMEFRVAPALSGAFRIGERPIDRCQGGVDLTGFRFSLGHAGCDQRSEDDDLLFAAQRDATTHFGKGREFSAGFPGCPGLQENALGAAQRQIMFSRDFGERFGERRGPPEIATRHLEDRRKELFVGDVPNLRDLLGSRGHVVDEPARAIDFSERPQGMRQSRHGGDAHVAPEAMSQIAVPLGVEDGERLFVISARLDELSLEPMRRAIYAVGDAGFGRTRLRRHVAQKIAANSRIGPSSPRRKLPTHSP